MALNRMKFLLPAAAAVAASGGPALAQDAPRPTFEGPRVEALVGTDGDLLYGGAIGYDLQRGKLSLGLEGELDLSDRSHCETLVASFHNRLCERDRRDLYVGGRIGVVVAPATLLYAKVGYSHIRQRVTYDPGSSGDSGFAFVDARDGLRLGAGIEQRLGGKVYVKGEYRYSNYTFGGWKHDGMVGIGIRF
jgi:outer membrane immunogenic protein